MECVDFTKIDKYDEYVPISQIKNIISINFQ